MNQVPIVIVQNGPQKGHSYPIQDKTTIGRDPSNTIRLQDQRISRQHCQVWREGIHYKIRDLNSRNGTYVNNLPVTETILVPGDLIQLGETVLTFHYKAQKKIEDISLLPTDIKQTMILHKIPSKTVRELDQQMLTRLSQEKTINDLTALYHVGFSIYTIRDIDKLAERVLELVMKAIPAERGVVLLYDESTNSLLPHSLRLKEGEPKTQIRISTSIANEAFKENIALLTKDALSDKRFDAKTSIIQEAIRSAMCVPVGTKEKTFGVIYLDTKTATAAFNEDTLRLLTAISNQVAVAIENIHFHEELKHAANTLQKELKQVYNMVGTSPQMKEIFNQIAKVSATDSTVLIAGESGTGKELVARAIHYNSGRNNKPFICVDCTTIPETLIESELFGHEKGAFTGAYATKPGQFELADDGTIFLDEIGEMPIASQVKLLRVLEENKIRHVGGTKDIPTHVRVIAASNKDLEKAVKEGAFREDLYYRLKVIQINIEPLRERKEDIALIAQYYFEKFKSKAAHPIKGFSPEALQLMEEYSWPGNVRQLKNCIERAIVLGRKDYIGPKDLDLIPQEVTLPEKSRIPPLAEIEKAHIVKALQATGGNKTQAADLLGIQRSTLYEKLKLYNIA